ncbi:FtsX-like permease family protein [Macrococcoides canis]|uniref:FtsX-like permease family protein n=1 Tax=Macrococcoides canis TaxID=1855823 RepID=UPI00165E2752|nr:ABC transporter permease [Macrococcus canis]QNR07062.1 FtsX-like permease family protein [Macrococcus canis]
MLQLLSKLVIKNFKSLRQIFIPFILATSVMLGLQYIMLSMIANEYIQKRHANLPQLLVYSNVLVGILTVVFIIYANRFVMKQRKQEFALNMVLGLEKKHIRFILLLESFIQFIVISLLSVCGGYLFGNLVFLLMNKLVKSKGMSLMDYPFDVKSALLTIAILAGVMVILFIFNNISLTLQSPIQLMRSQLAGEKKTSKWLLAVLFIIGAIALGYGYHIALTVTGVLDSLQNIFTAVLLVMVGTYFLFMSLTIIVLQLLKRNKNIYYKPNQFFSISGLLSRMKANAVGLASITMLMTFLMVTLGMSLSAYRGIEAQVKGSMTHQYEINLYGPQKKQVKNIQEDISKITDVDKFRVSTSAFFPIIKEGDELIPLNDKIGPKLQGKDMTYIVLTTEKDHNIARDAAVKVNDGEIIVSTNADRYSHDKTLKIMNQEVKVQRARENYIGNQIAIDAMYIIVKDKTQFEKYRNYFKSLNNETNKLEAPEAGDTLAFNVKAHEDAFKKAIPKFQKKYGIRIDDKDDVQKTIYELNGGLIFIGIVVSITLLTGVFLVLYYKQLSEGHEDKRNYDIMQKVGLPQDLIKKTINKQIIWIFGLPIIITIIHTLFATKIIFNLLGVLGIRDKVMFFSSYGIVMLVIMVVYGIMYLITSRTYYKIVNEK